MDTRMKYIKGIHPGLFLDRELKKRGIAKGPFALSIGEYPQTLSAITHGKRGMNTSLALRIEKALGLEEGTLMILQVYHDIKEEKRKLTKKIKPDLSRLRPALFWDTTFDNIDWLQHKQYVIDRVMERGTEEEKKLIKDFYASQDVSVLDPIQ
ncbi:plasmid maintenance system antidote protein [Cyclobacteriaceae bacterium YHN15]|nr:plasmid maintenance system antidote protein [Cyclobacteriaceae bacterium YHN15]